MVSLVLMVGLSGCGASIEACSRISGEVTDMEAGLEQFANPQPGWAGSSELGSAQYDTAKAHYDADTTECTDAGGKLTPEDDGNLGSYLHWDGVTP